METNTNPSQEQQPIDPELSILSASEIERWNEEKDFPRFAEKPKPQTENELLNQATLESFSIFREKFDLEKLSSFTKDSPELKSLYKNYKDIAKEGQDQVYAELSKLSAEEQEQFQTRTSAQILLMHLWKKINESVPKSNNMIWDEYEKMRIAVGRIRENEIVHE